MLEQLRHDVTFALRTLIKRPLLSSIVIFTLALGIGVNSTIFSVVSSVLLAPTPFGDPDRLMFLWASNPELARRANFPDRLPASPAAFYEWQRDNRTFEKVALMRAERRSLTGRGEPEMIGAPLVTGDFFSVLGVQASLGRTLLPSDDVAGQAQVTVVSHGFWLRRFGGDASVVNSTILLSGRPVTVVGVMPPRFVFPRGAELPPGYGFPPEPDVWLPRAMDVKERAIRGNRSGVAVGRLRSGVTRAQAQADLDTINARQQHDHPESDAGWGVRVDPLPDDLVGDVKTPLLILLGAVGFVLLIACANVANLLLAQANARQREIAIRTAIGAGRGRLAVQMLTESVVLSAIGGTLGLVAALWSLRAFIALVPASVPGAAASTLDGRVLAFTAGLSLGSGLLFGLAPAVYAWRADLTSMLRDGARTDTGGATGRGTRQLLVVGQMAIAVVLLAGAGLLIRSFIRLGAVDPGFRVEQVLTLDVDLPGGKYQTDPQRVAFFDEAIAGLRGLPGVKAAGAISALPMVGVENLEFVTFEGRPAPLPGREVVVDTRAITPGYLEAVHIPLIRGRLFAPTDGASAPPVTLINDVMARTYWPDQDQSASESLSSPTRRGRP